MAKRRSKRTSLIAPSWLAAIGLAISVTSMWQPRMFASADTGQRLTLNLPPWILFGLVAAAVAMLLALISVLLRAPHRKDPAEFMPHPPRRLRMPAAATCLASLLPLAASIAAGAVAFHLYDVTSLHSASSLWSPPVELTYSPTRDKIAVPTFDFALTLTLGAVTAVITAFALLIIVLNQPWAIAAQWFERSRRRRNSTLVADLTSAMLSGIHELEVGDDPRSAVIACYRRCEIALASHRRGRYASETPREFVHEALAALRLPALAVHSLLRVFEKARFSQLPVSSSDRSAALRAFGEIRSALERRSEDGAQL